MLNSLQEKIKFANTYSLLPILIEAQNDFPKSTILKLLGENWSTIDNFGIYHKELRRLFKGRKGMQPWLMTSSHIELVAWHKLAKNITVFRGCYSFNKTGFSWTLNRKVAVDFAIKHHRYTQKNMTPLLLTAQISKFDIAGLVLDRNEDEVVIISKPKNIKVEILAHR